MSGTVNISRSLWDDEAFKDAPFSEREAWIWLIAEASWKERKRRVGDYIVSLERGQLAASTRYVADVWGWTHSKARRFIERLKKLALIRHETDTGVSVITICNYDKYQWSRQAGDTPPTQDRHTSDTKQKKGGIREKEGNKEEEAKASSKKFPIPEGWVPSEAEHAYAISQHLHDSEIQEIADEFQIYWSERTDAAAKKTERGWGMCWRNHIRRVAAQYIRNRRVAFESHSGRGGQGGDLAGALARRIAAGKV